MAIVVPVVEMRVMDMHSVNLLHRLNKYHNAHIIPMSQDENMLPRIIGAAIAHEDIVIASVSLDQMRSSPKNDVCIQLISQYNIQNLRLFVCVDEKESYDVYNIAQHFLTNGWNVVITEDNTKVENMLISDKPSICFGLGWSECILAERMHSYNNQCVAYMHDLVHKYKQDFFLNRPYESTASIANNMLRHLFNKMQNYFSLSRDYPGMKLFENIEALKQEGCSNDDVIDIYTNIVDGFSMLKPCVIESHSARDGMLQHMLSQISAHNGPVVHFVTCDDTLSIDTSSFYSMISEIELNKQAHVFRPADALETVECLECALSLYNGHAVIVLNNHPSMSIRFCGRKNLCANGAYILVDDHLYDESVTLIASGNSVPLALNTRSILNKEHISVRIVSMPCAQLVQHNDPSFSEYGCTTYNLQQDFLNLQRDFVKDGSGKLTESEFLRNNEIGRREESAYLIANSIIHRVRNGSERVH